MKDFQKIENDKMIGFLNKEKNLTKKTRKTEKNSRILRIGKRKNKGKIKKINLPKIHRFKDRKTDHVIKV